MWAAQYLTITWWQPSSALWTPVDRYQLCHAMAGRGGSLKTTRQVQLQSQERGFGKHTGLDWNPSFTTCTLCQLGKSLSLSELSGPRLGMIIFPPEGQSDGYISTVRCWALCVTHGKFSDCRRRGGWRKGAGICPGATGVRHGVLGVGPSLVGMPSEDTAPSVQAMRPSSAQAK